VGRAFKSRNKLFNNNVLPVLPEYIFRDTFSLLARRTAVSRWC